MKTEIIAVGTEILMGHIVNTNSQDIAQALLGIGLGTYYQQVIGDNPERMKEAFALAGSRSDIIIVSGGLGPTRDDITKQMLGEYLGQELVADQGQLDKIKDYFKTREGGITETDYFQALTFKEGETFFNEVGLACGSVYRKDLDKGQQQYFIVLPGPPFEMRHMLHHYLLPYLTKEIYQDHVIESLYVNFYQIGEAKVAEILDDLIVEQTNPTIAIYAQPRRVTVRITASYPTYNEAMAANQALAEQIIERLAPYFLGYGEHYSLEHYVVEQMKAANLRLSAAESLTGGLVMEALTEVPGSSEVLTGGFVTYQTESKTTLLGIDSSFIQEHSVVSEAVAKAMAEATLAKTGTDLSLALTGVAGPDSLDGRRAGTVFIALAVKDQATQVKQLDIRHRPRGVVRDIAKSEALSMVKQWLDQNV